MSSAGRPSGSPSLADLLARYLERHSADHAAGLGVAEGTGEVFPYEAGPVQPVEPRAAWEEALAAARFFAPDADFRAWRTPPDWPNLVSVQEPVASLAFCTGNYPQLVRDLQALLRADDLATLRPVPGKPLPVPTLAEWCEQVAAKCQFPEIFLALGCLRLARHSDAVEQIFASVKDVPAVWQAAWNNERAAADWQRGAVDAAEASWLKQPENVPVLFNRGMAALFLGRPSEAVALLDGAVSRIPETSAWHHLGRLYQTLAEARR